MNVRVADIATVYREWNQRGAQFLTEPLDSHGAEQRCYLRDPGRYLIELGATTPRAVAA
ncbi:MAG TPA: VOC family protein [Solirubrobacteraceae bacterium]|nr:VOC family protein [Solirubrobacteraceae bacterium]